MDTRELSIYVNGKTLYIHGVEVGTAKLECDAQLVAIQVRKAIESERDALRAENERLRDMSADLKRAVKLLIGRANNIPWNEVGDAEVIAYMAQAAKLHPCSAALLAESTQPAPDQKGKL
jgi:hypothetical protein